jgi:Sulfite exporter TauE/SafE.
VLYILIFLSGIASGFLNVVAGGGSLITLPLLTMLGMGIDIANGTNRIAILLQNIVAVRNFHKNKSFTC